MQFRWTDLLLAIAAIIALAMAIRACNVTTAEARIADLDSHIRLLIEAKRNAAGDDIAINEIDGAIVAAVAERTAIGLSR